MTNTEKFLANKYMHISIFCIFVRKNAKRKK